MCPRQTLKGTSFRKKIDILLRSLLAAANHDCNSLIYLWPSPDFLAISNLRRQNYHFYQMEYHHQGHGHHS